MWMVLCISWIHNAFKVIKSNSIRYYAIHGPEGLQIEDLIGPYQEKFAEERKLNDFWKNLKKHDKIKVNNTIVII